MLKKARTTLKEKGIFSAEAESFTGEQFSSVSDQTMITPFSDQNDFSVPEATDIRIL